MNGNPANGLLMNGMQHTNANPVAVAQESLKMGKETGDRHFKFIALIMMAATGLATLLHAGHVVWRDMREDRKASRGNGRSEPNGEKRYANAVVEEQPLGGKERSWVEKAQLRERPRSDSRPVIQRAGYGR
jgi:hypothetical protein